MYESEYSHEYTAEYKLHLRRAFTECGWMEPEPPVDRAHEEHAYWRDLCWEILVEGEFIVVDYFPDSPENNQDGVHFVLFCQLSPGAPGYAGGPHAQHLWVLREAFVVIV